MAYWYDDKMHRQVRRVHADLGASYHIYALRWRPEGIDWVRHALPRPKGAVAAAIRPTGAGPAARSTQPHSRPRRRAPPPPPPLRWLTTSSSTPSEARPGWTCRGSQCRSRRDPPPPPPLLRLPRARVPVLQRHRKPS